MLEQTNVSACSSSILSANSSTCSNLPSYVIACSFGVNMVLGLPANCYILWLSVKEMIRGQSSIVFVFNAAFAEVIFCFCFAFIIRQYFFNCTDCRTPVIFLGLVLLVGRPLFQSCICVERYLGVLHPLIFLKLKPMKYRIACSAVGWILIFISSILCTMDIIDHYKFLLPVFLILFLVKLYSCLMVLKALLRPGPSDDAKQREAVNQDKLKAFRLILITLMSAVITYGPLFLSLVLYHIVEFQKFRFYWSTALCLGIMMGFVQPFLYLKRVGKLCFC